MPAPMRPAWDEAWEAEYQTRVRAHPRKGTKGVRQHARQVKPKYHRGQLVMDGNAVAEVWHVHNKKHMEEPIYGVYSSDYGFVEVSEGNLRRAKTMREIDAEIKAAGL
jgi:hypothetical protein